MVQGVLTRTADRIRTFAEAQRKSLNDMTMKIPGGEAGHTVPPVNAAGCYAPGGRYFLPIIITFLPEINLGFNQITQKISKLKFSILFNTILVLFLLNLPVLEYRNTNLTSYMVHQFAIQVTK